MFSDNGIRRKEAEGIGTNLPACIGSSLYPYVVNTFRRRSLEPALRAPVHGVGAEAGRLCFAS